MPLYNPTRPREISRVKKLFNVQDYDVRVTIDRRGNRVAGLLAMSGYKEAHITLFSKAIAESYEDFSESMRKVFYHEMAELAVASHLSCLAESSRDTKQMMEYRDEIAEHWAKSMWLLEGKE